ncbi:hypothetical protein EVA_21609, partial [gut metagenome]
FGRIAEELFERRSEREEPYIRKKAADFTIHSPFHKASVNSFIK